MEWLNYHHLLYFWTVAREGGIQQAAARLRLAPPTVHAQIRALEEALGEKLLVRQGRRLVLTEMGRVAFGYADEIFGLGRELMDALKGRPTGRPQRVVVGIADVVPKLVARRLLQPVLQHPDPVRLVCIEGRPEKLFAALSVHEIDVVITDVALPPGSGVRAFNHLLGECGVTFLAARPLAARYRHGFPRSLDGAPLLLPGGETSLRRALDQWLEERGLLPRILAECDDSALLKVLGQDGLGLFAVPSAIEAEVRKQYRVDKVGDAESVRERFFAISPERRLKHPAVVALCEVARQELFR
jgi:LysR family transcriptional activator of nhaA